MFGTLIADSVYLFDTSFAFQAYLHLLYILLHAAAYVLCYRLQNTPLNIYIDSHCLPLHIHFLVQYIWRVCLFYFSCDCSIWWESDLAHIDSHQAAKPIIISSKTLIKLNTSKTNPWNRFVIIKQNSSFSVNTNYWNINWNIELKHRLKHGVKI